MSLAVTITSPLRAEGLAVINEFHYNSENEAYEEEFIELHNPGDAPYDLTGHTLQSAVTFTFPSGTIIPTNGTIVIAKDPAVIFSKFGVSAVGPWSGSLSSSGEKIELRNGTTVVDSVDYKAGFPWPTMADGGGPSAELINPALDNNLGSSWRSAKGASTSGTTFISLLDHGWKYKKGTVEASTPVDAWRAKTYDDSTWSTGQAAAGYDDDANNGLYDGINIPLNDMRNSYSTVYLRKSFQIAGTNVPDTLKLKVSGDDGYIIWINGTEVARTAVGTGQIAYNATASVHNFDAPETYTLTNASAYLTPGNNVVAVHVINANINSTDLYLDLSLDSNPVDTDAGTTIATPGAANSTTLALAQTPPAVTSIAHTPQQPTADVPVVVTAALSDPDGVASASLAYQLVNPGSYIRKSDASYETSWTTVAMNDAGTDGDATAGDGIFTVTLPAALQTHRRLVRYRVTAADTLGNSQRFPYEDDEQPNFAYFVYNGIPAWTGAMRPTSFNGFPATSPVTYSQSTMQSMPALHLIANGADVTGSQYDSAYYKKEQFGTVVQNGVVFDHVTFRNRGQGSTYVSGKNKWKISFNRARDYQAYDNYGRPYKEKWNELPINSNASPWAAMHRGSAGIEEASSHRLYQLAGMAAMHTQFFQFRVIDDASESGADQYSGDLWGLYMGFEPTEGNFIDEHDLQEGNLYDIAGSQGDKERQGPAPYFPLDDSDWVAFRTGVTQTGQTEQWYRDNVDLPTLYTFLAINRLIGNVDVRPGDNYRFYHRPDGKWVIIPYDLDMMYIAAHHWGGSMDGVTVAGAPDVFRAIMRHPAIALEYRNRCREILSLAGSDGSASGGQIGQLLNEYASFVSPSGAGNQTWANIDAAMWNLHPRTNGGGGNSGQSSHKGNFFRATYYDSSRGGLGGTVSSGTWIRTLPDADADGFSDHAGLTQWFIDYATNTWTPNTSGETWNRKAMTGIGDTNESTNLTRQKGYGYQYLKFEAENGGWGNANANPATMPLYADFPDKPVIAATGSTAVDNLSYSVSAFSDPQGGSAAAVQWRIAQISAPGIPGFVPREPWHYELEATWTSPSLSGGESSFQFPLGIVDSGKRYRVRARYQDSSGNWSYWSDPVTVDATAALPRPLLHYWNFNGATLLAPTSTIGGAQIQPTTPTGSAILAATGQDFVASNARNGDPAANHLRFNGAHLSGAALQFNLPTSGYRDCLIQYETRRSGSGSPTQTVEYSLDGTTWQSLTSYAVPDGTPLVVSLDLSPLPATDNQANFAIRITFAGGTGGNNRFDNVTVEGRPITPDFAAWQASQFNGAELADPAISGPDADPSASGIYNLMRHAMGLDRDAPLTDATGASVIQQLSTTSGRVYRFRYNPAATDIRWQVKAGTTLTAWPHILFDSSTTPAPAMTNGWVEIALPASLTGDVTPDPRQFLHLNVSKKSAP